MSWRGPGSARSMRWRGNAPGWHRLAKEHFSREMPTVRTGKAVARIAQGLGKASARFFARTAVTGRAQLTIRARHGTPRPRMSVRKGHPHDHNFAPPARHDNHK